LLVAGRRSRLRYLTPVSTRPPSFALFASKRGDLPVSYRRYLVNALGEDFDLPGHPDPDNAAQGQEPLRRALRQPRARPRRHARLSGNFPRPL
jgi:GTP-binding protein